MSRDAVDAVQWLIATGALDGLADRLGQAVAAGLRDQFESRAEAAERGEKSLAAKVAALREAASEAMCVCEQNPCKLSSALADTAAVAREHDRQKRIEGAEAMLAEQAEPATRKIEDNHKAIAAAVVDARWPEGGAK